MDPQRKGKGYNIFMNTSTNGTNNNSKNSKVLSTSRRRSNSTKMKPESSKHNIIDIKSSKHAGSIKSSNNNKNSYKQNKNTANNSGNANISGNIESNRASKVGSNDEDNNDKDHGNKNVLRLIKVIEGAITLGLVILFCFGCYIFCFYWVQPRRKFAFIKGWEYGIINDDITRNQQNIYEFIKKKGITTICINGELLKDGSFTNVIPFLFNKIERLELLSFDTNYDDINIKYKHDYKNDQTKETGYPFIKKDYKVIDYKSRKIRNVFRRHKLVVVKTSKNDNIMELIGSSYMFIKNNFKVASINVFIMGTDDKLKNEKKECDAYEAHNNWPHIDHVMLQTQRIKQNGEKELSEGQETIDCKI